MTRSNPCHWCDSRAVMFEIAAEEPRPEHMANDSHVAGVTDVAGEVLVGMSL